MTIAPKSGNTILITGNINLIDTSGNLNSDNAAHVAKLIDKGCIVLLMLHVKNDAEEDAIRKLLEKALPSLPQKNLIFFECIQSIYSICRQIEPNYVLDAYDESYKLTSQFFKGRYFKTDAGSFRATITV
ncbi:hypothetical protein QR46_3782 [Giardia duodenalis assemblage B]|uniref:Uncharacterized protein n=3 Tax=Giardia intestinalis TaxID=5741 RepID=A0A132NQC0_GIAIN|nr:Hypothetical protein GL50581_1224 [Giardia intestinalis ATCC 50581]ESU42002.1 Hypothetical protein GSB_2012 [Giardia intestinalis]KWX12238.1 hypothetical protein QR46_3782 [Giardia intestinalis assemblage B]